MKICMFVDAWTPWWGGGQTHVWEASQKLVDKHNCSIDIIVPNLLGKNNQAYSKIEEYFDGKLHVIRLGIPFVFPNMIGRILFVKECLLYAFLNKYDIYHSHNYLPALVLPIIKLFRHGKVVFTLHGMGTSMLGAGLINKLGILEIINKFVVYGIKYDAFITVAKRSLNQITNTTYVSIIGNGVNLERYSNIKSNKSTNVFRLLWVGRMVPVKGLSILISQIIHFPKVQLILVGDGPERQNLESLTKKLNIQNRVKFLGKLYGDNLIIEYKKANLFVLPSISAEGFPVTIVEAMAAKLPVIASDIGDTHLLVQNNKTGYLIKPNDGEDLYNKLIDIISDPNRDNMGTHGYDLVKKKYTWNIISKQIYEVYSKILKK